MEAALLDPHTAWRLVQDRRAQPIDLRGRVEVDVPRIPGARWIPLDELDSELVTLDRERAVILVSGTGQKAAEAMEVLRAAGVTSSAVAGGMRAWLEAGLPTEHGDGESVRSSPPREHAP